MQNVFKHNRLYLYPKYWVLSGLLDMPELRVVVDEKFNQLLDKIVERGLYNSKAELMRSGAIYLLSGMGVLREHVNSKE